MFCSIIIDEENKNKIRTMYDNNTFDIKVTIKCKYFAYPDKILNHTPIPKVIVNLICEYIDDEITFNSTSLHLRTSKVKSESIVLESIDANINFTNVNIYLNIIEEFQGIIDFNKCENLRWQLLKISENVLICQDSKSHYNISNHTYNIFKIITNKHIALTKLPKSINSLMDNIILHFEIVNYEIMLIICNIIYTLLDTYKQCSKQKS